MEALTFHRKIDHQDYWGQPNDVYTHDADAPCSLCEVERLRHQRWAFDESKLSRVTLVNEQGIIAYERYGIDVAVSIQDEGRTLKVFVHDQEDR